jgi:hypothetical protein
VSQGTPALEESALEVREAPGADGVSLGVGGIQVDGASPSQVMTLGGLLWDWVMHGADIGASESSTQGDATLAPGSLGVVGLGYLGCSCWVALAFHLCY